MSVSWLRRQGGFTLIELLVVIAIIAVLVALLVPAVQQVREAANRMECANNLKQIGLAVHCFVDADKHLPPSRRQTVGSWFVWILPYMEQQNLYAQWNLNTYYFGQTPAAQQTTVKSFFCPSRRAPMITAFSPDGCLGDPQAPCDCYTYPNTTPGRCAQGACGDYAGSMGTTGNDYYWGTPPANGALQNGVNNNYPASGPLYVPGITVAQITDGLSNTLLAGEKHVWVGHFGDFQYNDGGIYFYSLFGPLRTAGPGFGLARTPSDQVYDRFGSWHPGIVQFVFCDGSVHGLRVDIDTTTLGYLASRNDGQSVHFSDY
jgi:prepilin-type N-terminal cleavage/methylation domain-containing protein